MIKNPVKGVHFTPLFYYAGGVIVLLLVLGFSVSLLFRVGQAMLLLLFTASIADTVILFQPQVAFRAVRKTPRILGLGDNTQIELLVYYSGTIPLKCVVIDELPEQLQVRNFTLHTLLKSGINRLRYSVKPVNRGIYSFGNLIILASSTIGLIKRKVSISLSANVPVYPSVLQMHQVELLAFSRVSVATGSKNLRRIGQSYEFEQITPFVEGDDYRNINWKATGKTRELMVNQFQDERSQNVYCIISKGRSMKMAFNGMTMLDYAINSTLAMSNVALKKYDRVGLITFSDKIGAALRADNRYGQLQKILEALYAESERGIEPSYELLYKSIDRVVHGRSMLLLFSNFETPQMVERVLPILRKINKKHLVVQVLFKDRHLDELAQGTNASVEGIYQSTLAKQQIGKREEIAYRLSRNGIQTVVSYPEQLSVNTINKYLELKSRGLI